MKTQSAVVSVALALCAAQSFAVNHTVTFRKMDGTVLQKVEVAHGADATSLAPELPSETNMTAQNWDCVEKLACVTNDVTCWALYEASTAKSPSTSIASQSVVDRETPYSLDEYFQMYNNLAWSDEFSGTSLSAGSGWNTSGKTWIYNTDHINDELQQYTTSGNTTVSGGTLKITARREDNSGRKFTSASVKTQGKVQFKYGRCEIRAKLTKQQGTWPAFWLMGSSGNWPNCGELDIFEQVNGSEWIGGNFHLPDGNGATISNSGLACTEDGTHWGDAFHRIGVIINEFEAVWYVDDHIFKRMDIRNHTRYSMLHDRSWHILLNLAFGGGWPGMKYSEGGSDDPRLANFTSEDYVIDYCRIFTNTTVDNTVQREAEPEGTKLATPVKATIWRGWQMRWGKSGASYYQNHLIGRENEHVRTALREYFGRDNADIVAFHLRPVENTGEYDVTMPFDVPGVSVINLSPEAGSNWKDMETDRREKLLSTVMFNKQRFSPSKSAIGTLVLSNDANFTNCCATVSELVEKDTGAKVKVVSAFVSTTNGVGTAGGTVAQGFDTLISKLNAMKDERVILLLQGEGWSNWNYLDNRVKTELKPSYSRLGQFTSFWPAYQSAWVTSNYVASAENPEPLSVPKSNGQPSGVHTNQAYCATVQFDEALPESVVEYGPLATNQYAKSMNVLFAGAPDNATLTNFPVLVKLSTAIDGFSYSDFSKANGGDLRFADANGTLLPHEIDTWNPSGVSTVWVKVPLLKKNSYITAHYGFTGSGDPAPVAAKDVWDDDFVGVWHLGESALPLKESSETTSDFEASYGNTINYATNGIVGHAIGFPAGGLTNAVVAADHDALDGFSKFTLEAWTYQIEHKQNAGILTKRASSSSNVAYYIFDQGSYDVLYVGTNSNTSAKWAYNTTQALDEWNYLAYAVDMTSSSTKGYLNGSCSWDNTASYLSTMPNCASDLILGNLGKNSKDYSFNGKIDEVRISKTARSAAWVKATYDTIANDGFVAYSFGEIDFGENITNLLLKAATDKANPIGYEENENIRFDFRLDGVVALPLEVKAKEPLHVIWTRTADDGVTVKGTNTISVAQGFSVTTRLAIPGIVKMTGTLVGSDYKAIEYYNASNEKKNITFGGGAGVATEKMQLSTVEPADFDQFWADAKAKLASVPFEGQVELIDVTPASLTNQYYIYAAKVPCFGPRPVTGWLTVPRRPQAGGVPIQANFDGYGCISAAPKVPTYGAGQCVRFAVNAHGYDMVGHNDQYYKDFNDYINKTNRTFNGKTYTYALAPQDYDNPTNTYFYYMAMRVMRAFQYLKTRPEWNGSDVVAAGGSQGGLQTMWAGGLVEGITKIQPQITWGCDIGCPWNGNGPYPSRTWGIPCVEGAYYFDSALHAKRVPRDCVAEILRLGMGDYTCPPRGVLLSYYNMKCQVLAKLVQGSDHGYVPPSPNQTFTISKEAEAELLPPTVADADGFDWTNRVVTVTGAQAGKAVTLSVMGRDGTPVEYTATADSNGSATFNVQTDPGAAYSYTVTQEGAAPASGTFSTGSWKDSGTWFAGAVENNALVASGGSWVGETTVAASGNALEGNASFALDADAVETGSNRLVRVDFDIVSGQFCLEADLGQVEGAMFGCIGAVACSDGNAWFAYDGSAWHRLYGDYTLAENAAYIVRAEIDLAQGAKGAVRYYVSDNAGTSFAPLFADASSSSAWITCNAADSRAVKSVAAEGTKTLASVGGSLMGADIAEADGVGYESLADAIAASTNSLALLTNATWPSDTPVGTIAVNLGGHSLAGVQLDNTGKVVVSEGYSAIPGEGKINITLAQAAALGVNTSGKSPAQIASALAENGANGIPLWQSYALGLDPTDVTAKPRATIAMNGSNVELRLVGITVNAASGATVTYKVYRTADITDMANAEPASGDKAVDATASVPKGASEDKMFYQLKVDVKGY